MSYSAAVKSRHSQQPFPIVPQPPTVRPNRYPTSVFVTFSPRTAAKACQGNVQYIQILPPLAIHPNGPVPYQHPQMQPAMSTPSSPQQHIQKRPYYPDVYTQIFVPEALRAINSMPATPVRAMPPPNIDYQTFVSSFCGSSFLKALQPFPGLFGGVGYTHEAFTNIASASLENLDLADNETVSKLPAEKTPCGVITPENYVDYFAALLRAEIAALNEVSQTYNLYSVPVTVHDPVQHLVRLAVPGIRENTPMVQLGDMVKLRQIRAGCFGFPGCFTGYEYETFVFGMDKTEGYIVLRADGLWPEMGGTFNVVFCVQEQLWDSAHRAVTDIGLQLCMSAETGGGMTTNGVQSPHVPSFINPPMRANTFLRRMLFPEEADGEMQHTAKSSVYRRRWFDTELNFEQVWIRVPGRE